MKSAFVVAGICAFLVGCIGPSKKEYRKANFGDYPTNFHRLVETWVEKNFDEPRGVRVSTPVRCEIPSGLLDSSDAMYGWCSGVSFEARDAFNQYTPRQHHQVYIRHGEIITTYSNSHLQPRMSGIVRAEYFD